MAMEKFTLDELIENLSYPCNGNDVINSCNRLLPADFCNELSPKISGQTFNSADDLHAWFAENITTHMAGLLGGASVQQLIRRGKAA